LIILYHANCNDGSASALAAWMKLGDEGNSYIAVSHGKPPPPEVVGEDVLIVDFSYPRDILLNMKAKSVLILDHHISAQKALSEPFPEHCNITVYFDMTRSGAMISWQHFFPDSEVPLLIKYVQDRDIWINEYPQSAFLTYGLRVFSEQFRDWRALIEDTDKLQEAVNAGESIFTFIHQQSRRIVASREIQNIGGFDVPVINAPGFMASDILHIVLVEDPDAPFVASYSDILDQGVRSYSLRSEDHREDVSLIAKKYGGGGHRNASGFGVELEPVLVSEK
jgi:oligoribonuclease NrnB/cAMP/cGMP phosphodiesterase (DHH superfamily)